MLLPERLSERSPGLSSSPTGDAHPDLVEPVWREHGGCALRSGGHGTDVPEFAEHAVDDVAAPTEAGAERRAAIAAGPSAPPVTTRTLQPGAGTVTHAERCAAPPTTGGGGAMRRLFAAATAPADMRCRLVSRLAPSVRNRPHRTAAQLHVVRSWPSTWRRNMSRLPGQRSDPDPSADLRPRCAGQP